MQMGVHAVKNILRATEGQPTRPFVYHDLGNMATIGRAAAVADFGWLRLHGLIGWIAWLFVHIFNLIGFRNRVLVMIQWAWAYITYQRSVRLITGRDRRAPMNGPARLGRRRRRGRGGDAACARDARRALVLERTLPSTPARSHDRLQYRAVRPLRSCCVVGALIVGGVARRPSVSGRLGWRRGAGLRPADC